MAAEPTTETREPVSSTVVISEPLAKFLGTGEREMVDTEVLRRVWEYVKVNHLEVGTLCTCLSAISYHMNFPLICGYNSIILLLFQI